MLPVGTNLRLNKLPKATIAIILANIAVFTAECFTPGKSIKWLFETFGYGPGNWYNPAALLSSMFLHGGLFHIVFNMLFLWIFGPPVEERVGSRNFVIYYFAAGCAAGILQTVVTMIAQPWSITPGIGASGAISGIMAIFLYRCFYSKMKMMTTILLLPKQFNIPVVPVVAIFFLQNFLLGLFSLSRAAPIAYWAHVGGFVCGIAIGRLKRYGHEGRIEGLREKMLKKLEDGAGWEGVGKEIKRLLKVAPGDPEINLDMARFHLNAGENKPAGWYYRKAAQLYYRKNPEAAAYTVLEHQESLHRPMSLPMHLQAAETLCAAGDIESAEKVIAPCVKNRGEAKGPSHELALALYCRILRHLNRLGETFEAVGMLMRDYPESTPVQDRL